MKMFPYSYLIIIFAITLLFINLPKVTPSFDADKITNLPDQPPVNFQQFAGYINVDETQKRNLFYYFVQAENNPSSKPLVLWLNGGPGCSSIGTGAFSEHGPFRPSGNALIKNDYSWNKEANMLYLESPAGKWLEKYPEYKNRDFFITGESYGGHYVPQLANLLGNPLLEFNTDFNSRIEYLWSHGLISDATYELSQRTCNYSQIRRQSQKGHLSPSCALVASRMSGEMGKFINSYDVTLDVCYRSPSQQAHILNQKNEERVDVCLDDETTQYLNRKMYKRP
ncbi:Serine carboxypeptidase-like 45 [Bienertia sinuspersici]